MTAPFHSPSFKNKNLACVFLLLSPPPSLSLRVLGYRAKGWASRQEPCAPTLALPPLAVRLHRSPPLPQPLCSHCARFPAAGAHARPPSGLPAFSCLPLSRTSTPGSWATQGVSPGYARIPTGLRTPHSQGPCLPAAISSNLLSTSGREAPGGGFQVPQSYVRSHPPHYKPRLSATSSLTLTPHPSLSHASICPAL